MNPCGIFRKIKAFEGAAVFDSAAFFQTKSKKRGENGGKRREQPGRRKAGGREETESPNGENQREVVKSWSPSRWRSSTP